MHAAGLWGQTACSAWMATFCRTGPVWSSVHLHFTGPQASARVSIWSPCSVLIQASASSGFTVQRRILWQVSILAFSLISGFFPKSFSLIQWKCISFLLPCPNTTFAKTEGHCGNLGGYMATQKGMFLPLLLDFLKHWTVLSSRWRGLHTLVTWTRGKTTLFCHLPPQLSVYLISHHHLSLAQYPLQP